MQQYQRMQNMNVPPLNPTERIWTHVLGGGDLYVNPMAQKVPIMDYLAPDKKEIVIFFLGSGSTKESKNWAQAIRMIYALHESTLGIVYLPCDETK